MRKNGRHTLVIDGNYFLFRTLYVLPKPKGDILGTKKDMQVYMRKLATDFAYQIKLFEGLIDNVVWTVDSRSWRKDFYPEAEYKGNRKPDKLINWDNFSKVTDEFKDILTRKGVITSKVDGAEGDDLMYAWNAECLSREKSVILFTGDRDLIQLVNKNESNRCHTILFSPAHKKLYTYQGFTEWLNTVDDNSDDIFDVLKSSNSIENLVRKYLSQFIQNKKVDIMEIDTKEFSFRKVLTGDSGDNIPPAYWYTRTSKDGKSRTYGVSEAKAQAVVDEFKQKHGDISILYLFNNEYLQDLRNILVKVMKAKYMNPETILTNIKNNVNLMILNSKTIPEGILDEMFRTIEIKMKQGSSDLKGLSTMQKLLENTEYEKASINMSAKILDDNDDDDDDFSFIKDKKKKGNIF
jgi:5'-3' exonuclease